MSAGNVRRWRLQSALKALAAAVPVVLVVIGQCACRCSVGQEEANAIGDVRTVMAAETAYAALNGGRYGTLDGLAGRATCGGVLPPEGPLLGPERLRSDRLGYRRTFHPGPPAPGTASSSAFASFAYTAVPIVPGRTGVRSFCGD